MPRLKRINPSPDQLTTNERSAMIYIEGYINFNRKSPTVREVAAEITLSTAATHELLGRLVAWKYLERRYYASGRRRARNLRLLRPV